MKTPDLPAFASLFAQQLRQLRATTQAALHQFQALLTEAAAASAYRDL